MARQMMNAGLQPALALLLAVLMYLLGLSWGAFVLCNEAKWHTDGRCWVVASKDIVIFTSER